MLEKSDVAIERAAMDLLDEALEHDPVDRKKFVKNSVGVSEAVRNRTLKLLQFAQVDDARIKTGAASDDMDDEGPMPKQIGSYHVLRLIGRGGMGNVYLAERAKPDFDQIVAIKLIKQRLITAEIVDRFRKERQILSDLNHPHIARLYDGGETDQGAPYFVMEYVDGAPLHHWLKNNKPSLDRVLEIFSQICSAVAFAHQHLVVHRDLTPPNILLDKHGHVKLIDFGIARPEEGSCEDGNTSSGLSFTPGFAAPERTGNESATVLTDIYSLGKILEILTAVTSDDEIAAIIRKAMAIKPEDRYQSTNDLITDLDRYQSNMPLSMLSHSNGYVLRKFVQRQKMLVIAASLFAIGLVAALIITTLAYQRADELRVEAERRYIDTRDIASVMMFNIFDEVSQVPGNTSARMMIADNAQRYLEALAAEPDSPLDIRLAAGRGYARLASVTGSLAAGNIGKLTEGLALFERSKDLLESVYRETPSDDVRLALADAHISLARDKLLTYVDAKTAVAHGKRSVALLREVKTPSAQKTALLGRSFRYLGDAKACCNDDAEGGLAAIEAGLKELARQPTEIRENLLVRRANNDLTNLRAGFHYFFGEKAQALDRFEEAYAAQQELIRLFGNSPSDLRLLTTIATNYSRTLLATGYPRRSEHLIAPVWDQLKRTYDQDELDNNLARSVSILALLRAEISATRDNKSAARQFLAEGVKQAMQTESVTDISAGKTMRFASRLNEAAIVSNIIGDRKQSCRYATKSLSIMQEFLREGRLPQTAKRYRMEPMIKQFGDCSSS